MTSLLLTDITVRLADRDVIQSFSLSAHTGDTIFISGDNGAGKSTLLKIIARYLPFEKGTLFLSERNCSSYPLSDWHSKVHYLPQQNTLAFPVKVKDLLVMAFYREKKWFEDYSREHYQKVTEWSERFSILHLLDRNAKELSGGELQLCWLVQSFLAKPEVLLLDEPTQYLDAKNRTAFFTILQEAMKKDPFICVCVTHDLPFRKDVFGRTVELHKIAD
ncbi:MAG: ABC transporter ATP-binding protein [Cytophagales bacterium]|nr:ABC transporter ATP-binding protein [Cytophaga sp.]